MEANIKTSRGYISNGCVYEKNGLSMKIGKGILMIITFLILGTVIYLTLAHLFNMDIIFSIIDSIISALLLTFALFLGYQQQST